MPRTISEAIDRAISFANRAIEADRRACQTNEPTSYEVAESNYKQAIELYEYSFNLETKPDMKSLLQRKLTVYRNRYSVMCDWLELYRAERNHYESQNHQSNALSSTSSDLAPYLLPGTPPNTSSHPETPSPPQRPQPPSRTFGIISEGNRVNPSKYSIPFDQKRATDLHTRLREVIISEKPKVRWGDVAGLTGAKDALIEATTIHDLLPHLFGAERKRWKTILLYGPPGVGKSYLAKAVASETNAKFYVVTMYDLIAKLECECESMVKLLFSMAREDGKVLIFFDDVDVLFSNRAKESENFRRMRVQFLAELQALREAKDNVLLLAVTRSPWTLEEAFLRRMDRRIYIPLPDEKARAHMIEVQMKNVHHNITLEEIENIGKECEGYTGADIAMLVRDAVMEPIRVIRNATFFRQIEVREYGRRSRKMTPCEREDDGAIEMEFTSLSSDEVHAPPVTCLDFDLAMQSSKPTVGKETIAKHEQFTRDRGQSGF